MNRNLIVICLLTGCSITCSSVRGQVVVRKPNVPAPVHNELPPGSNRITTEVVDTQSPLSLNMSAGSLNSAGVLTQPAIATGPETVIASTVEISGMSQPYQHANHPQAMHSNAGVGQLPMSFSLHRAANNLYCPLKLLHVPFGAWIEIEGNWYQHKSLDNTMDVYVNFEIVHSSFQPSVIIRTASNPGEIRQSETSMSKSILLIPGGTVEFDYARDFGEQLRKKLSRSELDRVARMSHAESDTVGLRIMTSAPRIANQTLQPDQIASIQITQIAANIELSARSTVWDVSPTNAPLLTLKAGTRLLSSLAPNVRLKADVKSSYVNGANETVTKTFAAHIEGELGRGRVSDATPDKAEIDCVFDFNRLFNGDSEFAKYIGSARNNGLVECYFTNVKLEFYNNRFDKALTYKFDGLALQPFTLKLELKFPK